jgi:hypothetical protein
MSQTTEDEKLSPAEQDAVRDEVERLARAEDLTRRIIADESGIPYGTLTPFLGGTYAGDGSRVAAKLKRWMANRAKAVQVRGATPAPPRFVATPTARAVMDVLAHAQHMPDMVVVTGAPGTGKSSAACEYTRSNPNVWKLVAEPSISTTRALLSAIAVLLGAYGRGSPDSMSNSIKQKLVGRRGLIIVDEAQHLTSGMLDQLRAFHDQCDVGVALVGNDAIVGRLEGGKHRAEFAQLYSRVGMRINRPKPRSADITALLDAWGVPAGEARERLRAVARYAGGLRNLNKCWRLAEMIARNEGRTLSADDVTLAWKRLGAATGGVEV